MPTDRQQEEENTRFQLGVIVGALQELPHRMDRFEASVNNDLTEIKEYLRKQSGRVTALETSQTRHSTIFGMLGAVIGAGLSGFLVKFWH